MRILIKDNWNELVLETNEKDFRKDIKNADMDLWWCVKIEYHDGSNLHSNSGRRVVVVNNRSVFAEWNFSIDGHEDVTEDLIRTIGKDFETTEVETELLRNQKEYKAFMMQTHIPAKVKAPVKKNEPLEELLDE